MIEIIWSPFSSECWICLLFSYYPTDHLKLLSKLDIYNIWSMSSFSLFLLQSIDFVGAKIFYDPDFILGFSLLVHRCHIPQIRASEVFSYVETIYWSTYGSFIRLCHQNYFRISWNVIEEDSKSLSPGGKFKKSWQLFFPVICNKPVCSKKKEKWHIDKKRKRREKKEGCGHVQVLNSLFQGPFSSLLF